MSKATGVDSRAVLRARMRTAQAAVTSIAGSIKERDAMTGDALPRSIGSVLSAVRRNSSKGRNPLPSDGLQELAEFVARPLQEVIRRPRERIERGHAMMALHRVREMDIKCAEWVGRQPGRTVREKLAGKTSVLGVRREFSSETNENILVAKLLRGLLPALQERLELVKKGEFDDLEASRLGILEECETVCSHALRATEFGQIDHRKLVRPNNVLLGDRRYMKLWRGWRWLRELESGDAVRNDAAPALFMQAMFVATCAAIDARTRGGYGDAALLVPTASAANIEKCAIEALKQDGKRFDWRPWSAMQFVTTVGSSGSPVFTTVRLEGMVLSIRQRRAVGQSILQAGQELGLQEYRFEFADAVDDAAPGLVLHVDCEGMAKTDRHADLQAIREVAEFIGSRLFGVLQPAEATAREASPGVLNSCGIDLGQSIPLAWSAAGEVVRAGAPCAIGFESNMTAGTGSPATWIIGATHAPVDVNRKGVLFASIRSVLDRGELLDASEEPGIDRIFRDLSDQCDAQGLGPATRKAIAIPDSVNELSQSALRRHLAVRLGRCMPVWRSSGMVIGWQEDAGSSADAIAPGDGLMVLDGRSDGLAVVLLQARHDKELARVRPRTNGLHWERRPAFTAEDLDPRLAERMRRACWRSMLVRYVMRVLERDPRGFRLEEQRLREAAERAVDAGLAEVVLSTGLPSCIPLADCSDAALRIEFDPKVAGKVVAEFQAEVVAIIEALRQQPVVRGTLQAIEQGKTAWHLLLVDLPGLSGDSIMGVTNGQAAVALLKNKVSKTFAFKSVCCPDSSRALAARGAAEIMRREAAGLPSVADWLPPLSLEVVRDGGFHEFTVLKEQVVRPLSGSRVSRFPVKQTLQLPAGVPEIRFPLFEGQAMRQDREVRLSSTSFPLSAPLKILLEVIYRHGEEQPYELLIKPNEGALASPIVATIQAPRARATIAPKFPPGRPWSDPWVQGVVHNALDRAPQWQKELQRWAGRAAVQSGEEVGAGAVSTLKKMFPFMRMIWGEGRVLDKAPKGTKSRLETELPLVWLERFAACSEELNDDWEQRMPDHRFRSELRIWGRRVLGCMHADRASMMIPTLLAEYAAEPAPEHVEAFGRLVGDGCGDRAEVLEIIVWELDRVMQVGGVDRRACTAILALGEAVWQHPQFLTNLNAAAPELVDRYLEAAAGWLEHLRKRAVQEPDRAFATLVPQSTRAIGETILALMRLRDEAHAPATVAAGSPLLVRLGIAYCEAERALAALREPKGDGDRSLCLRSHLRFDFERDPYLSETSDLAFVLRHYLNGGSSAMIEIVGVADDAEEG